MSFSIRPTDNRKYESYQIEKRMDLDRAFALEKIGSRKKRETQIDHGGIEDKVFFLEHQADVLVVVKSVGFGDEHLREISIDSPVPVFVAFGQVESRDAAKDAYIERPLFHGLKTSLDIADAFSVNQLGEGRAKEVSETREVIDPVIPSATPDGLVKVVHRQESHDLSKDGRLGVHRALVGV